MRFVAERVAADLLRMCEQKTNVVEVVPPQTVSRYLRPTAGTIPLKSVLLSEEIRRKLGEIKRNCVSPSP